MVGVTVDTRFRPGGFWYLVPVAVVVGSIALAVAQGIEEARDCDDRLTGIGGDGMGEVQLEAGTEPAIWAVYDSGGQNVIAPATRYTVTGPDGESVQPTGVTGSQTWNTGG